MDVRAMLNNGGAHCEFASFDPHAEALHDRYDEADKRDENREGS
jgi:hypothetical protein